MPAFDKYNPKYHNDWGWSLAIKGGTNEEIAEAFGIHKRTLIRWMKLYPDLKDSINTGKEIADSNVERKLYQRAMGIEIEEEQKVIDVNSKGKSKIGRITVTKKQIAPDTTAQIFWLKNRNPTAWRDVRRNEVCDPDGNPLELQPLRVIFTGGVEDGEGSCDTTPEGEEPST